MMLRLGNSWMLSPQTRLERKLRKANKRLVLLADLTQRQLQKLMALERQQFPLLEREALVAPTSLPLEQPVTPAPMQLQATPEPPETPLQSEIDRILGLRPPQISSPGSPT